MVLTNGTKASFLFSTLDGTIAGWNSKLGTANAISQTMINNSAAGASYSGLAILTVGANSYILAPNFGTGNKIEVYDSNFAATQLAGSFTDPTLPANYAPFSVHVLGTQVFISYALRTAAAPYLSVAGSGNGIVSVFDNTGKFVSRAVTGGNLNAPWGVAFAPASFGVFSNDLLIGNFGDGIINVYDPKTFAFQGQLMDVNGKPLSYPALWELLPAGTTVTGTTSVSGGTAGTVYFTSGLSASQNHGLFAGIANTVTTGSTPTFGFSASAGTSVVTAGSYVRVDLSIAPVNGFTGTVVLTCGSLPVGASCNFAPTTLSIAANAVSSPSVTFLTSPSMAARSTPASRGAKAAGIAAAMLFPFASLLAWRRRKPGTHRALQLLSLLLLFVATGGLLQGCGGVTATPTPAGTSTITLTATSGSISQSTTVALTVQ
jgi:uncharacterized protein (TIGR03118 family)